MRRAENSLTPIFRGFVENGKLKLAQPELFAKFLHGLNGEVQVTVKKPKRTRTFSQNAWYWSCVVEIPAEHFGYASEEMHSAFKMMFLRKEAPGKPTTTGSTTGLSTMEFSDYCEKCRLFCADNGLVIPNPENIELML